MRVQLGRIGHTGSIVARRLGAPAPGPNPEPAGDTLVIEVPEHLLARSRQRRAELTGDGGGEDAAPAPAASPQPAASQPAGPPAAPAPAPAPAPAVPEPAAPEPVPPYVEAAQRRKKMPVWAASVMVFLPIWAIFYVGTLEPPASDELVLIENGADAYSNCASCHGADGSGSATGRQLNDGELLLTFPAGEDFDGLAQHLSWVYLGTQGTRSLGLDSYGDPDRPGGARVAGSFANGMSGFANLGMADVASVVFYERVTHGGLDPELAALEEEMLLALVSDSPIPETGSPAEFGELLAASAELHGVGAAEE